MRPPTHPGQDKGHRGGGAGAAASPSTAVLRSTRRQGTPTACCVQWAPGCTPPCELPHPVACVFECEAAHPRTLTRPPSMQPPLPPTRDPRALHLAHCPHTHHHTPSTAPPRACQRAGPFLPQRDTPRPAAPGHRRRPANAVHGLPKRACWQQRLLCAPPAPTHYRDCTHYTITRTDPLPGPHPPPDTHRLSARQCGLLDRMEATAFLPAPPAPARILPGLR